MADRCTAYAQMVVDGKSPRRVGELEILACKRHLEDLERQNTDKFPYYYDEVKAKEVIDFAEKLIIAEGDEPKPVKLHGFQDFIFGSLYGWRNSKGVSPFSFVLYRDGAPERQEFLQWNQCELHRQFQRVQLRPALPCGNEAGSGKKSCLMRLSSLLTRMRIWAFVVKNYKSEIECKITNSKIRALSRDTKKIDGFRPLFGSVDEYHAHESNQMYKLLEGGTGNLDETLISIITTAGFNLNSPCYEMRRVSEQILKRSFYKETQFVAIYTMDKNDDMGAAELAKGEPPDLHRR